MSESQHWYDRTGRPCHTQEKADGSGLRDTTLRDARKLGLVPSFSTVDSIRNKYQLNRYLIREAVKESYRFISEPIDASDADEFADQVITHLDETAGQRTGSDMGTEIHAAIELLAGGGSEATQTLRRDYPDYEPHAEAALNEVMRLFPDVTDWISERTFANPMGFGGMVDLHSPSTGICVDFKTKDFWLGLAGDTETPTRLDGRPYRLDYDQYIQLAAYSRGLMLPINAAANVFISREQPGSVWSRVWTLDELDKGWDMFQHEFGLWCLYKGYDPSFIAGEEEVAA